MEVHYDEGIASHIGPESCAGVREGAGEALTGEHAGQPLSRESPCFWVPTRSKARKAIRRGASTRVPRRPGAVQDPGMYGRSLYGNRDISSLTTRKASSTRQRNVGALSVPPTVVTTKVDKCSRARVLWCAGRPARSRWWKSTTMKA